MKKTWRSILSLLLALVMLVGICSSTVILAFATDTGSESGAPETTVPGGSAPGGAATGEGNTPQFNKDWLSISYTDDEITVIVTPDRSILDDANRNVLSELVNVIIEGIKHIGVGQIRDAIIESGVIPDIDIKYEDLSDEQKAKVDEFIEQYKDEHYDELKEKYETIYKELGKSALEAAYNELFTDEYIKQYVEDNKDAFFEEFKQANPKWYNWTEEEVESEFEKFCEPKVEAWINAWAETWADEWDKAHRQDFIDEAVAEIEAEVIKEYLAQLDSEEFDKLAGEYISNIGVKEFLTYITDISVDGHKVFGTINGKKNTFSIDAVLQLVRELPTIAEIANMTDDEMRLSYDVLVATKYGDVNVKLNAIAGGGFDSIRKIAGILDEFIDYNIGDYDFDLHITVPAKFSELLLRACNSGRLTDEQKSKIFAFLSYDAGTYVGLYNDKLTFANIMELLESINFEGLLDKDFIKDKVDLTGLTNEQILAKVREYEHLYNRAFNYGKRILDKIPEHFLDGTLLSLYDGNGLFAVDGTATVDLEELLYKASEKYGELIASRLSETVFTASVDFSIRFKDIYSIKYKLDDDVVRSGLLPVGANMLTFTKNIDSILPIIGWMDEDGNVITDTTLMPERDIVLTAITAGVTVSGDVDKIYDGESSTVSAVLGGQFAGADVEYSWYKDGVRTDITSSSFEVKNVADSGEYYCVVTVSRDGSIIDVVTSNTITVSIEAAVIDVNDFAWNYTAPFAPGIEHRVFINYILPVGITVDYSGTTAATAPGDYTANATFTSDGNYTFKDNKTTLTLRWVIARNIITIGSITWSYNPNAVYRGSAYSVFVDPDALPEGVRVSYTDGSIFSATDAGDYTVTAVISAVDEYTSVVVTDTDSLTLNWSIAKFNIDISKLIASWEYDSESNLVYNGEERTNAINRIEYDGDLPDRLGSVLTISDYTDDKLTVGSATTKATLAFVAGAEKNYELSANELSVDWSIAKIAIDASDFAWSNKHDFTYNGAEQGISVSYVNSNKQLPHNWREIFDITYADAAKTDANENGYTAIASIKLKDAYAEYYSFADAELEQDWFIHKFEINAGDFAWSADLEFTYDGNEHKVTLIYNGSKIPAGIESIFDIISIEYMGNSATEIGDYTARVRSWTLTDTTNYTVVGTFGEQAWEIVAAPDVTPTLDFSGAYWGYYVGDDSSNILPYPAAGLAYEYGREIHLVLVVPNAPAGFVAADDLIYSGDALIDITNAGHYTATVSLAEGVTDRFNVSGFDAVSTFELDINKADIDLSGIKFYGVSGATSDIVTQLPYIGTAYTVSIELENGYVYNDTLLGEPIYSITPKGNIPATISPEIRFMGTYEVSVTFTINSNYADNFNDTVITWVRTVEVITVKNSEFVKNDANGNPFITVTAQNPIRADHSLLVKDESHVYTGFYFGDEYGRVLAAYDIAFALDGTVIPQDNNSFNVRVYLPAAYTDGCNVKVVYVDEFGNASEVPGAVVDGDYVTFTTTHFSTYAIVSVEPAPAAPDYFDFPWWIIVIIAVVLIIVAIVIVVIIKRRGNGGDDNNAQPVPTAPAPTEDDGAETVELPATDEDEAAVDVNVETEEVEIHPTESEEVEIAPTEGEPESKPETEEAVEPAAEQTIEVEEPVAVEEPVVAEEPVAAEEPVVAAPAAPKVETIVVPLPSEGDGVVIGGETVYVRYRSSFESRLIQAETEIQDYYTVIKNTLLSYKGVKARTSWNYEAYNKTRVQCAKLNIKGKSLIININLDPAEYNINKYHFIDMSDNPKFEQLPMQMKIKSDRALKYTVELIEEMMAKLEIPKIEPAANVDYHMPYETTEELAKRGLVKVILPPGMTLDENSNIVKVNVGALIDDANAGKPEDEVAETTAPETVAEPTVEAEPVVEPLAEHVAHEDAVEAEPVVETEPVVENEPVVEAEPVVAPLAEHVVHANAVEADKLLSDDAAAAEITIVHNGASTRAGKLCEVNLDVICDNYDNGETVNITNLKAKRIVSKNAGRIKVLARGRMTKTLTVVASKFSIQAVKMITLAGGHAEIED